MSTIKNKKNILNNKIRIIKNINDNPNYYLNDITTKIDNSLNLNELINNSKKNNFDIFDDLINLYQSIESNEYYAYDNLLKSTLDCTKNTLEQSKQILFDEVKKIFFVGANSICGDDKLFNNDNFYISPQEFDFLNVLKVNPNSDNGKLIYSQDENSIYDNVNLNLYNLFNTNESYDFKTNNEILFSLKWDKDNQSYLVYNITKNLKSYENFLDSYYSNIELFDFKNIVNNSMLQSLGMSFDNKIYNKSLTTLNRLIKKIFKNCGTNDRTTLKNQTTLLLFDENEESDIINFDDENYIDYDEEYNIINGIIKFIDCDNFETKISNDILEDFIYFSDEKSVLNNILNTIEKTAYDVKIQNSLESDVHIFKLSLMKIMVKNLPKSLLQHIFSPKVLLPIILVYKSLKNNLNNSTPSKDIIVKLSTLFNNVLKNIFWNFINNFLTIIKGEIKKFINSLVTKILKTKLKRYYTIITALINILTKYLNNVNVKSCQDLYSALLKIIELSLNSKNNLKIPNIMLGFSDSLPGYNQDRAIINIFEKLENSGISLAPIYGEDNDLVFLIKSIIEGNTEELDENSFVSVTNKKITIPTPVGPIIIPPGILNSSGKLM